MAPEVSPWRKVLSIALMVVGGLCGLALAVWLFRLTWSAIPTLQYSFRPTVLFLVGLLLPLAGGFFVYWLAVALGERVRSPVQATGGRNANLSLLAQLGMAYGLFVGVAISAYDSYVASDNLGRSANIAVFFLTGVVPVLNGLLAGGPLFLLSLTYWEEVGRRARRPGPRPPFAPRSALRLIAYAVGGVTAAGIFFVAYKAGWAYFFHDAVLRGEWPRAFWVLLLVYGAALVAWAVYYPFLAFAESLKDPAD